MAQAKLRPTAGRSTILHLTSPTTFYRSGAMFGNYSRTLLREVLIERGPYAQYTDALFVSFYEKGKRNGTAWAPQGYEPKCALVLGHEGPAPESMLGDAKPGNVDGITVREGRRTSFDDGWREEMVSRLDAPGVELLFSTLTDSKATKPARVLMTRARWGKTHADFRGILNGEPSVTYGGGKGTCLSVVSLVTFGGEVDRVDPE